MRVPEIGTGSVYQAAVLGELGSVVPKSVTCKFFNEASN